jgi:3-isopropylmalate/(R)-2-methylmalate dehydratase small subunit
MILRGKVYTFGDDINTDLIIPARYLNSSDPLELARHCMEDARGDFAATVEPGSIIVAGKNFGCGSSREHAPIAIKYAGISCVVAAYFARIFFRNAINIGLPIVECPALVGRVEEGQEITVDLDRATITIPAAGDGAQLSVEIDSFPPFMQKIIEKGGWLSYLHGSSP